MLIIDVAVREALAALRVFRLASIPAHWVVYLDDTGALIDGRCLRGSHFDTKNRDRTATLAQRVENGVSVEVRVPADVAAVAHDVMVHAVAGILAKRPLA